MKKIFGFLFGCSILIAVLFVGISIYSYLDNNRYYYHYPSMTMDEFNNLEIGITEDKIIQYVGHEGHHGGTESNFDGTYTYVYYSVKNSYRSIYHVQPELQLTFLNNFLISKRTAWPDEPVRVKVVN